MAESTPEETWCETGPLEVWRIKVPDLASTDGKQYSYVLANFWTEGNLIGLWLRGTRIMGNPFLEMPLGVPIECDGSPTRASRFILANATDFNIIGHHYLSGWAWMFGFFVKDAFVGVDPRWNLVSVVRKSDGVELKGPLNKKLVKLMGNMMTRTEVYPVAEKKSNAVCFFTIDVLFGGQSKDDKYGNAFQGMDGNQYAVFCHRVDDITDQNSEPRTIPVQVPKHAQSHYSTQCMNTIELHHKLFAVSEEYFLVTMPCTYNTGIYSFSSKTPGREVHKLKFVDYSQDIPITFFAPHLLLYPMAEGGVMDGCRLGMVNLSSPRSTPPWKGHGGTSIDCWDAAILDENVLAMGCIEENQRLSIRIWRRSDGFESTRLLKNANKRFNLNHCYDFLKEIRFSSDGRYLVVFVHQKNGEVVKDCVSVVTIFKWEEEDSAVRSIAFKTKPVESFFGPMDGYPRLPCNQMWAPIFWDDKTNSILALTPKKLPGKQKATRKATVLTPTDSLPATKYVATKMTSVAPTVAKDGSTEKAAPDFDLKGLGAEYNAKMGAKAPERKPGSGGDGGGSFFEAVRAQLNK